MIGIVALFRAADLLPSGPVPWAASVPERNSGVYVIVEKPDRIIYIGRATSIAKRLGQFYRHEYGKKAPHRGGQEILPLKLPQDVYWAPVEDFQTAESKMIGAFRESEGQLPYGNKIGGARRPIVEAGSDSTRHGGKD